jgi:REP-associated tyrosine transposase
MNDLARYIEYIHFNPVKHGLVDDPGDWAYSTWAKWKAEEGRPINIAPEDWKPLHLGEHE